MSILEGSAQAFEAWANQWRAPIEARLLQGLSDVDRAVLECSPLHAAMAHGVLNGGKRVRALAALAAGQMCAAPADALLTVAAALEFVHAYSLIHDDLPCMDDDVLRRGLPTVHVAFGEAQALLAGDALQTHAFALLVSDTLLMPAATKIALLQTLSHAIGANGMAGGQAIDVQHVGLELSLEQMQTMHSLKTGALLRASLLMGAQCGAALSLEPLQTYAQQLGLLFQVVDDVLDASQSSHVLGKTAGKDAAANKPTYVRALGLSDARAYVQTLYQNCLSALTPYGVRAQPLADLAAYCANRIH
jgi:farnesyl diphosphate synthase